MKITHILLPLVLVACSTTRENQVHHLAVSGPQVRMDLGPTQHPQAAPVPVAKVVDMTKTGDREYQLVLRDFPQHIAVQREANWCWAACLDMVNKFRRIGGAMTQEKVVAYFKSAERDEPARAMVIMRGLHPDLETMVQRDLYTASFGLLDQRSDRLIVDLAGGQPAIVGLNFDGTLHACVVIGASYALTEIEEPRMAFQVTEQQRSVCDNISGILGGGVGRVMDTGRAVVERAHVYAPNALALRSVTIVDPWDGSLSTLTADDFARRCTLILTPSAARAVLEDDQLKVNAREDVGKLAKLLR